jgi:hypothetical protein
LTKMMNDPSGWCGTADRLHELPSEYFVTAPERATPVRYALRRSPRSTPKRTKSPAP